MLPSTSRPLGPTPKRGWQVSRKQPAWGLIVPPRAISTLHHHGRVLPFLSKAQMGSDHVVGVAANLIQLPSQVVDNCEPYVHDHFLWGRTVPWKTFRQRTFHIYHKVKPAINIQISGNLGDAGCKPLLKRVLKILPLVHTQNQLSALTTSVHLSTE